MKKADTFEPLIQTHISDWMREMWEVEAQHPPMIGSRLKFALGLPLSPAEQSEGGPVLEDLEGGLAVGGFGWQNLSHDRDTDIGQLGEAPSARPDSSRAGHAAGC